MTRTTRREGRHVGSPGFAAAEHVEHRRGVTHGSRDDTLNGRTVHRFSDQWARRGESPTRFQPDESAAGRWDADRPTAVVGAGAGHDARGDSCRGASRTATRRPIEIPGVTRRPPCVGLGDSLCAELRGVGFAEDDQARVEPALDDGGVLGGVQRHQRTRTGRRRQARVVLRQILDQERHPGERTGQIAGRRRRDVAHDGVDLRVYRRRPLLGGSEQLSSRNLLVSNQFRQRSGIVRAVLVKLHPTNLDRRDFARWSTGSI